MPTENELKYVLPADFQQQIAACGQGVYETLDIQQGYVMSDKSGCVRIRQTNGNKFKLCFKKKIKSRLIEIEKRIGLRDFNDLWQLADCKLHKIRYNLTCSNLTQTVPCFWSIDFYKDEKEQTYFVLAEHEMPEGQTKPKSIPPIIAKNLLFAVPQDDNRFTARKLADIKYAKKLYSKLLENKNV